MKENPAEKNDDDTNVDPAEIETASERLLEPVSAPEDSPDTENLTEWDQPPDATGTAAPKVLPEDEVPAAEELVEEGVEEADRDQRLAATDPDFEP